MGTGDLCRMPPAAVHPGRARQCSGTGPCGYCRRVLWVPGPRGQYSGKIRFIEKPGVQDEWGRYVAKHSSDPRVAYPEVNVQVRDLVRVVGIVVPFASLGFSIQGKFVLSIGQGKSSIPALSYFQSKKISNDQELIQADPTSCPQNFQVGGMKHDQELYAKVSYIPSP